MTPGDDGEIVVTGTLIRGIAPVGTNVRETSRDDVKASGATNVTQLLQTNPRVSSFNNLQFPFGGSNLTTTNRPNLRGVHGEQAGGATTLVLVDGMRIVGMGVQSTSPDPDIIPPGMIERIEIMPDGGSSIYGSDAVGGVMNFITRKDFDGLEANARYGFAANYHTFDANATIGKSWDSGSALVSYNYAEHDALFGRDRDYVRLYPASISGIPFPVTGIRCAPGNVQLLPAGTIHTLPYAPGAARPNTANQCDEGDDAAFYPRERRHSLMARLRQELGSSVAIELRGFYTDRQTYQAMGQFRTAQFIGPAALGLTPSPFQPAYKVTANPVELHQVSFAFGDSDANNSAFSLETWGVASTLTADLGASWQLRTAASYGQSTTEAHTRRFSSSQVINAIRAGLFNPYDPQASDPAALAAQFRTETYGLSRQRLLDGKVVLDGTLVELPGGGAKFAGGLQFLRERLQSQKGDTVAGHQDSGFPGFSLPANLPGNPLAQILPAYAPLRVARLHRSSRAVFGELVIPVFGTGNGFPGMEEFIVSASARHDHYSDFGSTFNPRFGATYKPLRWVTLRGSWGESFVAPSLADNPLVDLTNFFWVTGSSFNAFSPPADLIADGTWPRPAQGQNYLAILGGSAPGIRPQSAKTLSLGIDVAPPFVPGLTLSGTYWKIDFKDLIGIPPVTNREAMWRRLGFLIAVNPTQAQIDELIAISNLVSNPCQPQPGCLYAVLDGRKRNLGRFKLAGIDFAASYVRATGFGSIDFSFDGVYELRRKQRLAAGAPYVDFIAGNFNRFEMRASAGARIGRLRAQATLLHTGGYTLPAPVGIAPQQTRVRSFDVVNLFFKYDASGDGAFKDLSFTLNVDNLLNQKPPEYRAPALNGVGGFANGNTLGRLVQFGVAKKF